MSVCPFKERNVLAASTAANKVTEPTETNDPQNSDDASWADEASNATASLHGSESKLSRPKASG
jgi:hypothetical protein